MSESQTAGTGKEKGPSSTHATQNGTFQDAHFGPADGNLVDALYRDYHSKPLPNQLPLEPESRNAPSWLRPFFSLRVQLTFVFSLILILVTSCSNILLYQQTPSPFSLFILAGSVIIGIGLAFAFTSLLLRPLWQVTDATQAIASGDLEQRERLPLRLPPQDEIDRLSGSVNEMTTRLEHAEMMQHASEQRFQRFFSDASHQLRTPLTSIRGFTEILLRGMKDDKEALPRILTRMKNETERMTNLINDLLTISRLEDTNRLKLKYVDLIELAIESIEQTRARANDERKIALVLATEERLGLQADRERMKQLLFILLDNALKYGRPAPDGTITLKLARQNKQAEILVVDNGEGIASEDLEHIFDAFYRGHHRSASTTHAGTGLGLTIASAIVRAHNGKITVDCKNGGETEFKVTIPCTD